MRRAARVGRTLDDGERAFPRRRDRDRRKAAEAYDGVEEHRGVFGGARQWSRAPVRGPRRAASESLASAPASAGCRRCRRMPRESGSSSRNPFPGASGSMPEAKATADPPDDPAGLSSGFPRVACRAEQRVDRVGAGRELRRIGLGEHDGAGGFQTPDHLGVFGRDIVLVERDPYVVRMPAVTVTSLMPIGRPWRGPVGAPRMISASAACAAIRA